MLETREEVMERFKREEAEEDFIALFKAYTKVLELDGTNCFSNNVIKSLKSSICRTMIEKLEQII